MSGYCPDCGNTMCICKDISDHNSPRDKAAEEYARQYAYHSSKAETAMWSFVAG